MPHVRALCYLLLGFASRLVDWVLVLFGLPGVLLLILLRRLETGQQINNLLTTCFSLYGQQIQYFANIKTKYQASGQTTAGATAGMWRPCLSL